VTLEASDVGGGATLVAGGLTEFAEAAVGCFGLSAPPSANKIRLAISAMMAPRRLLILAQSREDVPGLVELEVAVPRSAPALR